MILFEIKKATPPILQKREIWAGGCVKKQSFLSGVAWDVFVSLRTPDVTESRLVWAWHQEFVADWGIPNPGSHSLGLLLQSKREILNYLKALKEIHLSQCSTYTLTWHFKMQRVALFFFFINQSLIMDNQEFGSTCCIILALPLTPLWPWKFLVPCTHLPIPQWIWCLPSRWLDVVELGN